MVFHASRKILVLHIWIISFVYFHSFSFVWCLSFLIFLLLCLVKDFITITYLHLLLYIYVLPSTDEATAAAFDVVFVAAFKLLCNYCFTDFFMIWYCCRCYSCYCYYFCRYHPLQLFPVTAVVSNAKRYYHYCYMLLCRVLARKFPPNLQNLSIRANQRFPSRTWLFFYPNMKK